MSKEVQFERIAEPGRDAIIFNKYFRDRMVDVERVLEETYPKSWNLRPYDITTGQITKKPRILMVYQKVRKETERWDDFKKLS